jgi:glutathione synthase/RimK-type ligase-like ATP-grasp enzyme
MRTCAFLSLENPSGWFIDDSLAEPALADLGWRVDTIAWTQPTDWDAYDLVIVRSPWDYQQSPGAFFAVLESIERSSAHLANQLSLMRWNADKRYLLDLQERGASLVPTLHGKSLDPVDLLEQFDTLGGGEFVVKPRVGASGDHVHRLRRGHLIDDSAIAAADLGQQPFLVQPFIPSITTEGEFAVIFIAGKYSHCVLRTPGQGDFRVQRELGGSVMAIPDPPPALIETARKALTTLEVAPLYARVDLVRMGPDNFALMELELIEPGLYFEYSAEAPQRFARAVDQHWKTAAP